MNEPKFQIGDLVISFRGEPAKVTNLTRSTTGGKSHRVEVEWEDPEKNPDKMAYYEGVFNARQD